MFIASLLVMFLNRLFKKPFNGTHGLGKPSSRASSASFAIKGTFVGRYYIQRYRGHVGLPQVEPMKDQFLTHARSMEKTWDIDDGITMVGGQTNWAMNL